MARQKSSGRRVGADNVYDILAVKVALLSQECLLAVVMVIVEVLELPVEASIGPDRVPGHPRSMKGGVAYRPAGECAGALADVVFSVIADAH